MRILKSLTIATGILGVVACQGGGSGAPQPPAPQPPAKAEAKAEAPAEDSAPAGEPGNIKITVKFDGKAPAMGMLNRKSDPFCAKTKVKDPSVTISDKGALQNVVVGIAGKVKGDWKVPTEPLKINQDACMYTPRVMAGMVGQKIEIANGDKTLHNVHGYKGHNEENWFNVAQPPSAPVLTKTLGDDHVVRFKCDVHPWMTSWISLATHPFNKMVNEMGEVMFEGVPSRKKPYKIMSWHEKYGKQETEVMVEPGKTHEITLTYKADQQG